MTSVITKQGSGHSISVKIPQDQKFWGFEISESEFDAFLLNLEEITVAFLGALFPLAHCEVRQATILSPREGFVTVQDGSRERNRLAEQYIVDSLKSVHSSMNGERAEMLEGELEPAAVGKTARLLTDIALSQLRTGESDANRR